MSEYDSLLPRSVRVGGMDKRELVRRLRERGVQFNQAAEALFEDERFATLGECQVIEIESVSVCALGFQAGATYEQLTARAFDLGLVECPLELGPQLRLHFVNQPEGPADYPVTRKEGRAPPGSIAVASTPLDDCEETPKGFYLRRVEGVDWLRAYWSWPGHILSPEDVLVFSRTRWRG
jgi:hypothetical protein